MRLCTSLSGCCLDWAWWQILEFSFEKLDCLGYKSGRFFDAEIHYHSTFKEILAIKKAISKFEFHLIGHHFLVEMDMSSFPQMIKFKQKIIPNPQLLRWAEWFSKYSFDCKHIKGKTNVLADLLTRPNPNHAQIMMYKASSSQPPRIAQKPKENPKTAFNIPPNLNPEFPSEVYRLVLENKFHSKARDMIFEYQLEIFRNYGGLMLNPFGLHPDYPFIHPIHFEIVDVPDEVKWLLCIQWEDVRKREDKYIILQKHMCQINRQIPREIWPPPKERVPWDTWPEDPSLLRPYHKAIMEAQQQYKDDIPDPSEWSQDYPWYESSASKIKEPEWPRENDDHMEIIFEDDNTSIDSAQLPHSNRD
ncbi:hypothetical protein V6N11_066149 [Hibiscus sabdariffa]|uniref:Reverse transcriptase RNase H-like domain-containing protein n=1 Tax=Hibiscus sabdariffa TaxID=183260 RepID=A0ABR2AH82_9ROSI